GMTSVAKLFVAQIQDYLLDGSPRMNTPGKADGNWQFRISEESLTKTLSGKIRELTERYGRC
ncbi:MAG: 4-alpha-glucanotransferase, partial [Clostridia bacterium]|nr:4-alpha-glucanotransferase [Clostridia bacterium]